MDERNKKAAVGSLVGGLCGALTGALLLGVPTYMDTSAGFLGTSRSWTMVAVIAGIIYGGASGVIIGAIVGAVNANQGWAMLAGTIVASPTTIYLFSSTERIDREVRIVAALCLPAGAFIGLIVSIALSRWEKGKRLP